MAEETESELLNMVENWQLGRLMKYEHEEARPENQFALVIDLNRCTGCQGCVLACKTTWTFSRGQEHMWWCNVETKPFGGYPHGWDVKTLQLLDEAETTKVFDHERGEYKRVLDVKTKQAGRTVFEAAYYAIRRAERVAGYLPSDEEWRHPNPFEDVSWEGWLFVLPRICAHCTYPACLAACPSNAIYRRPEDGIVLIDQERCRGYRKCVEACPYKKVFYRSTTRKSEMCHGCYPRVEKGEVPICVGACPERAMLSGWVDKEGSPVHYLVRKEQIALPLYPQFGTEPNLYYIPPRENVPHGYLAQMFANYGEELVRSAIDKYTHPSPQTQAVLRLFGVTTHIIASYKLEGENVAAYDQGGTAIISVPVKGAEV